VYMLNQNSSYAGETATALGNGVFSVAVANVNANTKIVTATGYIPNATNPLATTRVSAEYSVNTSVVSFRYGVQVGAGGVTMSNGTQINGNLVSDGSVSGSSSAIVTGDVIVASGTPATSISGITVNGDAYAHSLSSCGVQGNAYYATTNTCSVTGTSYPGSTDQPSQPLPISDQQITDWKNEAISGGTVTGDYSVQNNKNATLGPKEITGNLDVGNGGGLTITGTLYVHGSVTVENTASLTVSSSLGAAGAAIIADGPITLSNGSTIAGNGNGGSTLLLLTTYGGTGNAIVESNNAVSAILYASAGTISISNNAHVTQVTGYKLALSNNAIVDYDQGLQSQGFSNGPGGSWAFVTGTYVIAP
jgi:hypothetical protein